VERDTCAGWQGRPTRFDVVQEWCLHMNCWRATQNPCINYRGLLFINPPGSLTSRGVVGVDLNIIT
jgi:hypothetical protein